MSAPAASTVTRRRSAAARAARVRGRASLRHRPASSSSSPRSTGSSDPCRSTTTARTSAVRASSLILQGRRVCQTNRSIIYIRACSYCFTCMCLFSVRVVKRAQCNTLSNVVSDGHAHKVPASRVERAGGGDGCEDIRCDGCARPSAVRVTGGPRSFSVMLHFFPIVSLSELDVARSAHGTPVIGTSVFLQLPQRDSSG